MNSSRNAFNLAASKDMDIDKENVPKRLFNSPEAAAAARTYTMSDSEEELDLELDGRLNKENINPSNNGSAGKSAGGSSVAASTPEVIDLRSAEPITTRGTGGLLSPVGSFKLDSLNARAERLAEYRTCPKVKVNTGRAQPGCSSPRLECRDSRALAELLLQDVEFDTKADITRYAKVFTCVCGGRLAVYPTDPSMRKLNPEKYCHPLWLGCKNYHATPACRCTYTIDMLQQATKETPLDNCRSA